MATARPARPALPSCVQAPTALPMCCGGWGLGGDGVTAGDRVAILLPQRRETAIGHLAALKAGCVTLPLFTLFGPEALLHRLRDSGARVLVTDHASLPVIAEIRAELPDLQVIFTVDGPAKGAQDFDAALAGASDAFTPVPSQANAPAILIYTSGTTGNPKGALHAHRVLLGHLPGVEMSHDFLPQPGDCIWTPADWAWIGGLLDVLLPALHHGVPVVACRFRKFSARAAADLIRRFGVRNAFLPPTALKIMKADPDSAGWALKMRSVASGGEPLGTQLLDWGRQALGVTINEFYGQTECNMVISSCAALAEPENGVMGWPVPGHRVDVIDEATAQRLPDETEGAIAILSPDPVMFLGYWKQPVATAAKFLIGPEGRWLVTGDRGLRRPDGRLVFKGRDDDIIVDRRLPRWPGRDRRLPAVPPRHRHGRGRRPARSAARRNRGGLRHAVHRPQRHPCPARANRRPCAHATGRL